MLRSPVANARNDLRTFKPAAHTGESSVSLTATPFHDYVVLFESTSRSSLREHVNLCDRALQLRVGHHVTIHQ